LRLDGGVGDRGLNLAPAELLLRRLARALGGVELRRGGVGRGAHVSEAAPEVAQPALCTTHTHQRGRRSVRSARAGEQPYRSATVMGGAREGGLRAYRRGTSRRRSRG